MRDPVKNGRAWPIVALVASAGIVACASIVGIESPTPRAADASVDSVAGDAADGGGDVGSDSESMDQDAGADAFACADGSVPYGDAGCARLCNPASDCPNGCCAPIADVNGNPIGPLVCKPADGRPYDCATGSTATNCFTGTSCQSGYCVVSVANGSCWCEKPCTSDGGQCGSGSVCVNVSGMCNGAPSSCLP